VTGRAKPRTVEEEKLLVTARALQARLANRNAFIGADAGYVPLAASSGHAVVFARTARDEPRAITVATRVAHELERLGGWGEHTVQLPAGRWRDVLTGATYDGGAVALAAILRVMPVALLVTA